MTSEQVRELREAATKRINGHRCSESIALMEKAILELFPEDSEEPVTEDWLREVWGFESSGRHGVEKLIDNEGNFLSWREIPMRFKMPFGSITTRRQFRQLAAALTIEPKKGGV